MTLVGQTVAQQAPPGPEWAVGFDPFAPFSVLGGVVGTALGVLIVGALLVAFVPGFVGRATERVRERPGQSFAWGLFAAVAVFVVAILLVITIVGILVAVPLLIVAGLFAAVGDAVAFLAVGRVLATEFWPPEDASGSEWTRPLLLGAGVAGGLNLVPLLGGLVSLVVAIVGFGAVVSEVLDA